MTKLATLACVVIACGGQPGAPTSPKPNVKAAPGPELYDRLGVQRAIVAVIDDFIGRVAADPRIKIRFSNTDIPKLKLLLVEFVCLATGGPCKYTGLDMELVDEEFDALVEDLAATLDKLGVPAKEKGELLGALGPLKPSIVTPKD